jgi:hypothetical protein
MQIKIETIPTSAGDMHDLVLIHGDSTIRLALTCPDPQMAKSELEQWLRDNTLEVVESIRA